MKPLLRRDNGASKEFAAPQTTGPFPEQQLTAVQSLEAYQAHESSPPPPPARPTLDALKSYPITIGLLIAIVAGIYGAWGAIRGDFERSASARTLAIDKAMQQHDHDDRAHPGLRAAIERQGQRTAREFELIKAELREIHRLLSLQDGRRRRRR